VSGRSFDYANGRFAAPEVRSELGEPKKPFGDAIESRFATSNRAEVEAEPEVGGHTKSERRQTVRHVRPSSCLPLLLRPDPPVLSVIRLWAFVARALYHNSFLHVSS
jgi:hypothetical protein